MTALFVTLTLLLGAPQAPLLRDTTFLLPPQTRAVLGPDTVALPPQGAQYPIPPSVSQRLPQKLRQALQANLNRLLREWPRVLRLQVGPGDTLWLLGEDAQHWRGYRWPDLAPVASGPPAWWLHWTRLPSGDWLVLDTLGNLWKTPGPPKEPPDPRYRLRRFPGARSLAARSRDLWVATADSVFHGKPGLWGYRWSARAPGGFLVASAQGIGLLDTLGRLRHPLGGPVMDHLPPGSHDAALYDANQDGLPDLLFLHQRHPWLRRGLPNGTFWAPDTTVTVRFPFRQGIAPSLAFGRIGYLATPEGRVYRLHRQGRAWQPDSTPLLDLKNLLHLEGLLYPVLALAPENDDTLPDFVVGLGDGRVLALTSPDYAPRLLGRVKAFAAPVFLEGTWYAGDITGRIRNLETGQPLHLSPPPDSGSVFPAAADLTGDGTPELIVGQQQGGFRVYRRVADTLWQEIPGTHQATPELALPAPVDLNGDALPDLAVATLGGRVFAYETRRTETGFRFVERNSWRFRPQRGVPDFATYYDRSYLSPAGEALWVQADTLGAYARLLERTPPELLDEVAFSLAHTPAEILRVLARLHQEDLFLENARGVYRADTLLDYAQLVDLEDGRTTVVYADGDTLPPDLYGWYVVHPRILYEVPYRVDASYWSRRWQDYGIDRETWLRHEEDVYAHPDRGVFWRTLFQRDSTYGKTALDAVALARTLREAVRRLYLFQGWNTGGFMTFGYQTQDLQPVVIYRKAYGSCGEQSILFAALARTALIPTYVAIDMGEDHQWNEFWCCGRWHHLDVNSDTLKGIDHPATSVMKKTITAVVGWRPDDSLLVITGRYVDTASVDFQVTDSAGNPVPGALVVLRSHWNRRDLRAVWGYTQTRGQLHLPVGYQPPLGNAVEVLSPVGAAGIENVLHKPGQRYREVLQVPGSAPPEPPAPEGLRLESMALLEVHNPITSRPYRISSATLRQAGYEGTLFQSLQLGPWYPRVTEPAPGRWIVANPHPYLTLKVKASVALPVPQEPSSITLTLAASRVPTGQRVPYRVDLRIPAGLQQAELLWLRQDSVVRRQPLHPKAVAQTPWLVSHAVTEDSLDTGAGGPLRPGTYLLVVRGTDLLGRTLLSDTARLEITPAHRFRRQWVYQDRPRAPEPSASWILEFWVREPLRLLYVESEAPEAEGLDLDLFLYRDQNGDGKPSKKETVAQSTSPTNHEVLILQFPKPGHYWLYAQGCTVEQPPQPFNLTLSFEVDSLGVAREVASP